MLLYAIGALLLLNTLLLFIVIGMFALESELLRQPREWLLEKIFGITPAKTKKNEVSQSWRQVDALFGIYRAMDGLPALPPMGGWAACPDFVRYLLLHIIDNKPRRIIECGSGTTTIAMGYAVQSYGGHVHAIENHTHVAEQLERDLADRGLSGCVTIHRCSLSARKYENFEYDFFWYDLDLNRLPDRADMLVVDGPWGNLNQFARYPAGPELLSRLSKKAHIFLDDTARSEEAQIPKLWRAIYPDLGIRILKAEKGAQEVFFLDGKIQNFRRDSSVLGDEAAQSDNMKFGS